jgi:hypothetical protein
VKKYSTDGTEINTGSIIAVSGSKYRVVDSNEIINVSYDESGQAQADSLALERLVTGAIIYVTSDKNPVIITLQGHEEEQLSSEVSKQLGLENYTVKAMDFLTKDAKLSTEDTLLIYSPKKDLSKDEAAKIKEFLSNGGRAFFMMDIAESDMPNFQSVLSSYGVGIKRALIADGDASHSSQNQIYLLPEYGDHEIVSSIAGKNLKILLPASQALEILKDKKDTTQITPLLTTSENSWGKMNLNSETIEKEKGDPSGPFTLAAAITNTPKDTSKKAAKLVVVSDGYFADTQVISTGGNLDFFMNCVNWLQDKKESITIRPKSLQSETITISVLQRLAVSFFVVIIIPLIVIIIGAACQLLNTDYGIFGVVLVFVFNKYHENFKKMAFQVIIVTVIFQLLQAIQAYLTVPAIYLYGNLMFILVVQPLCLFSLLLLKFYNGERGLKLKYLFYSFYPVHLLILAFLK